MRYLLTCPRCAVRAPRSVILRWQDPLRYICPNCGASCKSNRTIDYLGAAPLGLIVGLLPVLLISGAIHWTTAVITIIVVSLVFYLLGPYVTLLELVSPGSFCPHCGYDLQAIESDACPVCGRSVPPAFTRTPPQAP